MNSRASPPKEPLLYASPADAYHPRMSITATVENDTIKLPVGVHLPDGTEVRIEPVPKDGTARRAQMEAWLKRAEGAGQTGLTTDEIMRMTRGED